METFFSKLAERLNSENNLSDITWALCSSNDAFQKVFLDFCFASSITKDIDHIEREFVKDNTRPDFLIFDTDDNEYLLEVKKYDKNLHDNYKKKYAGIPRAFIANYSLFDKNDVYNYNKTWHGLIEYIEKQRENNKRLDNPIIKGYLDYLKSVTNYFKGESMDLSNLKSLCVLLKAIKRIIDESTINGVKPKYAGGEEWSGFKFKFKEANKDFDIWFGISFDDKNEKNYLFLEFLDGCSKNIKEILNSTDDGKYFKKPYQGKESIIVEIKDKYFKTLCNDENSFEDQEGKLREYFKEVMNSLLKVKIP